MAGALLGEASAGDGRTRFCGFTGVGWGEEAPARALAVQHMLHSHSAASLSSPHFLHRHTADGSLAPPAVDAALRFPAGSDVSPSSTFEEGGSSVSFLWDSAARDERKLQETLARIQSGHRAWRNFEQFLND